MIKKKGSVTTLAGTGAPGYVDGPSLSAQFYNSSDLCDDGNGNIYVADTANFRIRLININIGIGSFVPVFIFFARLGGKKKSNLIQLTRILSVATYAGNGSSGSLDGPVNKAMFIGPYSLVCYTSSLLYVFDVDFPNRTATLRNIYKGIFYSPRHFLAG